jgi:glycosyltransferase involved in cell wall biosynthesis
MHANHSQIELLHIPFQYAPIYNTNIPVITTMHDIQEYHYPEYFSTSQKLHRKINNVTAINESDYIIVSFSHIKNDLLKFFNVKETQISVCPPPFTEDWFLSKEFTSEKDLRSKFQIDQEFLLYPAATWKHKNHMALFKSLSQLNNDGLKTQLICTGNKTEYFEDLQMEIDGLGLNDQVKFLGIVPEEDLIGLYKCTSLVVIPTKYEAGSGPLYEAMRFAVPVLCSNVTSLPETMGNSNYIFNPDDVNEIAQKVKKILRDETFRSENLSNSVKRLDEMGKVDYTKNFINVYRKLLEKEKYKI